MPTTTLSTATTSTNAAAVIQKLQSTYGPQAHALALNSASFYSSHLLIFQIIGLLFTAFFIGATIYIIRETGWLRTRIERIQEVYLKSNISEKHARENWADVERHFLRATTMTSRWRS